MTFTCNSLQLYGIEPLNGEIIDRMLAIFQHTQYYDTPELNGCRRGLNLPLNCSMEGSQAVLQCMLRNCRNQYRCLSLSNINAQGLTFLLKNKVLFPCTLCGESVEKFGFFFKVIKNRKSWSIVARTCYGKTTNYYPIIFSKCMSMEHFGIG